MDPFANLGLPELPKPFVTDEKKSLFGGGYPTPELTMNKPSSKPAAPAPAPVAVPAPSDAVSFDLDDNMKVAVGGAAAVAILGIAAATATSDDESGGDAGPTTPTTPTAPNGVPTAPNGVKKPAVVTKAKAPPVPPTSATGSYLDKVSGGSKPLKGGSGMGSYLDNFSGSSSVKPKQKTGGSSSAGPGIGSYLDNMTTPVSAPVAPAPVPVPAPPAPVPAPAPVAVEPAPPVPAPPAPVPEPEPTPPPQPEPVVVAEPPKTISSSIFDSVPAPVKPKQNTSTSSGPGAKTGSTGGAGFSYLDNLEPPAGSQSIDNNSNDKPPSGSGGYLDDL